MVIPSLLIVILILNFKFDLSKESFTSNTFEIIIKYGKIGVYMTIIKCVLSLITFVLTITERKRLIYELESSPLTIIDETLTEELYNNVINLSKHPDDKSLIKEYMKLKESQANKTSRTYDSSRLNESQNEINKKNSINQNQAFTDS